MSNIPDDVQAEIEWLVKDAAADIDNPNRWDHAAIVQEWLWDLPTRPDYVVKWIRYYINEVRRSEIYNAEHGDEHTPIDATVMDGCSQVEKWLDSLPTMQDDSLRVACSKLLSYRERAGIGFQLEKADDFLHLIRVALDNQPTIMMGEDVPEDIVTPEMIEEDWIEETRGYLQQRRQDAEVRRRRSPRA